MRVVAVGDVVEDREHRRAVVGDGVERVVELRLEAAAVGDDEGRVASAPRSRIDGSNEWASPPTGINASTAKWSAQSSWSTMSAQIDVVATTTGVAASQPVIPSAARAAATK